MLKSVSILICFLFSISSWAGPSSSLEDYEIQRTIQELCSYQDSIVFAGHFFNKAVESMRSEVEFTFTSWTARFIKSRGETVFQSRYMHDFIGSDAFIREMRSCYPHEGQRNRLVFLTLWADIAGQFSGVAQVGASFWAVVKILGFIKNGLYSTFNQTVSRLSGSSFKTSEAQFSRYFFWATTLLPVGYAVSKSLDNEFIPLESEIESLKVSLNQRRRKIELLQTKLTKISPTHPHFCTYNDLAYNLAQDYFSILRDAKAQGFDLRAYGENRDFRMKIRSLELCEAHK